MNPAHQKALYAFADKYGVPRNIAYALVRQESGGNPNARSPAGAVGYTQLMPGTARGLGVNPNDPVQNLEGGMKYLGHFISAYGGNIRRALAAYNAGPGAVQRYNGVPPYAETQNYVKSILAMAGPGRAATKGLSQNRLNAVNMGLPTNTPLQSPSPVANRLQATLDATAPSPESQSILSQLGEMSQAAAEQEATPISVPGAGQVPPSVLPQSVQAGGGPTSPANVKIQGLGFTGGKITPAERKAGKLVQEALGTDYVWGGNKPGGFDCSGLLQYAWAKSGVNIPRTTYDQWKAGTAVPKGNLRYGDAVFFRGSDARGNLPGHVGFYIGNGKFIEAPHTGAKVQVSNLKGYPGYVGARRYG